MATGEQPSLSSGLGDAPSRRQFASSPSRGTPGTWSRFAYMGCREFVKLLNDTKRLGSLALARDRERKGKGQRKWQREGQRKREGQHTLVL